MVENKKTKSGNNGTGGAMVIAMVLAVVIIGGYGAFAVFGGEETSTDPARTDDRRVAMLAEGETLYADNCAACHGASLEGETKDWKKRKADGTMPAPPHDATGHTWHHSDSVIFNYTKKGGAAVAQPGFKSGMPGFGETMSDDQIWAVLEFIKSKWPEQIRTRQADMSKRSG